MFEVYKSGGDVHSLTGEMIGAIDFLGKKEGRQVGKTGNFLWIYQGGPARLQATLWKDAKMRVTLEQCDEWTKLFHRSYPGFLRVNQYCADRHKMNGHVVYWNGRRRRIKELDNFNRIKHYTAFNSIVQGGASQILMKAANSLAQLQRNGAPFRMCSSVHDSLWVYIPKDRLEEGSAIVREEMSKPAVAQFELPFDIDMKLFKEYR